MAYRICSFNMHKIGKNKSNKDLDLIAKILNKTNFDIIAMQEVFSDEPIQRLVRKLSGDWDYRWGAPAKSSDGEGYAFLWDTNVMELSYSNAVDKVSDYFVCERKIAEPHIFSKYKKDKNLGQFELARDPYYGRFKPKNCFCEIRLINTHIRFGKDDVEHYSREGQIKETGQRKNEYKILADIYNTISQRTYGNNMPAYTLLLGDYNLNLNREWTTSPYVPWSELPDYDVYIINDSKKIQRIKTVQDSLTTFKQNELDTSGKEANNVFANNYDHFSYDMDRFLDIEAHSKRVEAIRTLENNYEKYKNHISDHLPIEIEINLKPDKSLTWEV